MKNKDFDPITGLFSLEFFKEWLGKEIAEVQSPPAKDVPSFAVILAKPAGGSLDVFAAALRERIRMTSDVMARTSRGVLGLMVPATADQAEMVAERVVATAEELQGASVGYAVFPGNGETPEGLLRGARKALACADASGGKRACRASQ